MCDANGMVIRRAPIACGKDLGGFTVLRHDLYLIAIKYHFVSRFRNFMLPLRFVRARVACVLYIVSDEEELYHRL